jgi:hypothetical protein
MSEKRKRDRRERATGKAGTKTGDRYAQISEEVLNSAAYDAQPDFAKVVLVAMAARYQGYNNGDLSLTIKDARALGVSQKYKLYAGLSLLKQADLIECTRQGLLTKGTKICSLYALTWRGMNPPPDDVNYDAGISISPLPSHTWAKWQKPPDWMSIVRKETRKYHGRTDCKFDGTADSGTTTVGNGRATTVGTVDTKTVQPPWVKETTISVPRVVVTSKTLVADAQKQRPEHIDQSKFDKQPNQTITATDQTQTTPKTRRNAKVTQLRNHQ